MKEVTIKDVAERAGVSISTVSNVLSQNKYVSEELAQRIKRAVSELGYEVNTAASMLKSNKSRIIGVIVPTFKSIVMGQILNGIQDACMKEDYAVCVYETKFSFAEEQKQLALLTRFRVDGIILSSAANVDSAEEIEYIRKLKSLKRGNRPVPVISIEKRFDELDLNLDCVVCDNQAASKEAVCHLIEQGHRKIGFLPYARNHELATKRLRGYREALTEAGIVPQEEWIKQSNGLTAETGYHCMRDLIDKTDVTAVFTTTDQYAIGAIKAAKDMGLRVPEDVAVAGFDNIFPGTLITPSLTSVNIQKYQMGTLAVRKLINRINNDEMEAAVSVVKHQLVVRKSTVAACDDTWDLHDWW